MPLSAGLSRLLLAGLALAGASAPTPLDSAGTADLWPATMTDRFAAATTVAQAPRTPQPEPRPKASQPHPQAPSQQPAPAARNSPALPVNLEQALYLVRSTLLTLNDANRSGNYTVLRDLAAPGFQAKNNAADLAGIFADLRRRHVDLFAVALMAPQLASAPALDGNGMLRLTGHFQTQPLQIKFDLLFQNVDNNWRLFGVSVQTLEVAPQANLPLAPTR
jgi:hypothetical protein